MPSIGQLAVASPAETAQALDRALEARDRDLAERLLAQFRPKDLELLIPYVECRLAGDEGGATRWRQQLEDCWKLERGNLDEISEIERRTGRQVIARVRAPTATTPPRLIARARCGRAARLRERRPRARAVRHHRSSRATRAGPDDPPPRSPALRKEWRA